MYIFRIREIQTGNRIWFKYTIEVDKPIVPCWIWVLWHLSIFLHNSGEQGLDKWSSMDFCFVWNIRLYSFNFKIFLSLLFQKCLFSLFIFCCVDVQQRLIHKIFELNDTEMQWNIFTIRKNQCSLYHAELHNVIITKLSGYSIKYRKMIRKPMKTKINSDSFR